MSLNITNTEAAPPKKRPLGVWVLTIFGLTLGGIFPLLFEPLDLLMGYTAFYSSKDIPIIQVIALLNIVIILTGFLTWKGSKIGQIFFLISVTVFF